MSSEIKKEEKPKTTMERSLDLKGMVDNLLKAASEVSHKLSGKISDIQLIEGHSSELSDVIESRNKEKEALDRVLRALRSDLENAKRDLSETESASRALKLKMVDEAKQSTEEISVMLESAKKKEIESALKLEKADALKRELEEKLNAISKIGGK